MKRKSDLSRVLEACDKLDKMTAGLSNLLEACNKLDKMAAELSNFETCFVCRHVFNDPDRSEFAKGLNVCRTCYGSNPASPKSSPSLMRCNSSMPPSSPSPNKKKE